MKLRVLATAVLVLVLWAGGRPAQAAELGAEATFNEANSLYEGGKYEQALHAYQRIIEHQGVSAALYFNAANACFKTGRIGPAIVHYRRALTMAPRDPDIRANLKFVRDQVKFTHLAPPPRAVAWTRSISLNEWTVMFTSAAAVWFLLLLVRTVQPRFREILSGYTLSLGLITLVLGGLLGYVVHNQVDLKTCVATIPEVVVRRGPYPESQSYFTSPDGAEFKLLEERGDWLEVEDGTARVGWVLRKGIEILSGGA